MAERRTLAEELGLAVAPVQPTALAKELGLTPAIPGAALPSLVPAHPAAVAPGLPGLPPLQLPPGHVPAAVVPPTAEDLTPLGLPAPLPPSPVSRPEQRPVSPTFATARIPAMPPAEPLPPVLAAPPPVTAPAAQAPRKPQGIPSLVGAKYGAGKPFVTGQELTAETEAGRKAVFDGLISPEKITQFLAGGRTPKEIQEELANPNIRKNRTEAFLLGAAESGGRVLSGFTSPFNLALMAAGYGVAKAFKTATESLTAAKAAVADYSALRAAGASSATLLPAYQKAVIAYEAAKMAHNTAQAARIASGAVGAGFVGEGTKNFTEAKNLEGKLAAASQVLFGAAGVAGAAMGPRPKFVTTEPPAFRPARELPTAPQRALPAPTEPVAQPGVAPTPVPVPQVGAVVPKPVTAEAPPAPKVEPPPGVQGKVVAIDAHTKLPIVDTGERRLDRGLRMEVQEHMRLSGEKNPQAALQDILEARAEKVRAQGTPVPGVAPTAPVVPEAAAPKPTLPEPAKAPEKAAVVQGRGIRQIVEGAGGKYKGIQEAVGDAPALVLFNEPSIGSTLAVPLEGVTEARVKERLAEFARKQAPPALEKPPVAEVGKPQPGGKEVWQMTPEERTAEVKTLRAENRAVLATPLMSEGGISPWQVGQMGKQQRATWEKNTMRRMDIESRIRTLESDERIAQAKARAEAKSTEDRGRTPYIWRRDEWVAKAIAEKPQSLSHLTDKQFAKFEGNRHAKSIAWAVKNGKPVPPEVLKDYPDLAAKYSVGAEPEKRHPATPEARETTAAPALVPPEATVAKPPAPTAATEPRPDFAHEQELRRIQTLPRVRAQVEDLLAKVNKSVGTKRLNAVEELRNAVLEGRELQARIEKYEADPSQRPVLTEEERDALKAKVRTLSEPQVIEAGSDYVAGGRAAVPTEGILPPSKGLAPPPSKVPARPIHPSVRAVGPRKIDDSALHNAVREKKSTIPILVDSLAKGGELYSTDLEVWAKTKTDLADGMYQRVGNDLQPDPGQKADQFPVWPELKEKKPAAVLNDPDILRAAQSHISKGVSRYELNGALIKAEGGKVTIAATDGHRLIAKTVESPGAADFRVLVPAKALGIVGTHAKGNPVSISVGTGGGDESPKIIFRFGGAEVISRNLSGTFPNYEAVLPREASEVYAVNRAELAQALKTLVLFADPRSPGVIIEPSKDSWRLTTGDKDRKISKTVEIPVRTSPGGSLRRENIGVVMSLRPDAAHDYLDREKAAPLTEGYFVLNAKYLLDATASGKTSDLYLGMPKAGSQAFTYTDDNPVVGPVGKVELVARTHPAARPIHPSVSRAKRLPPKRRRLAAPQNISDFDPSRDVVIRRGDRTFVVDKRGEHAEVEVQSDVLTPEFRENIAKLNPQQRSRMAEEVRGSRYLSSEGRAERLALLEELEGKVPPLAPIPPGPGAMTAGAVGEAYQGTPLEQLGQRVREIREAGPGPVTPSATAAKLPPPVGEAPPPPTTPVAAATAFDEAKAMASKIWEWYKNGYTVTDFKRAIRKFSGAEYRSSLAADEFAEQMKRAVPDPLRQEAILNWIEAEGDEAVLRQRAVASAPDVRAGYEAALTLTGQERTYARQAEGYYSDQLERGQEAGILEEGVKAYATHLWNRPNAVGKALASEFVEGRLQPNFKFAKRRVFASDFEGEQAGFRSPNKSFAYRILVYNASFEKSLYSRALIKSLLKGKAKDGRPLAAVSGKGVPITEPPEAQLVKPHAKPEEIRDYKEIPHPALRKWKWVGKDVMGRPTYLQGDVVIHPEAYTKLRNILGKSAIREWQVGGYRPGRAIMRFSSEMKQVLLSFATFHQVTIGVHGLEHRANAFNPIHIDLTQSDQAALVDAGWGGAGGQDWREQFMEGVASGGLLHKVPLIGPVLHWYTRQLFGNRGYVRRVGMTMALHALRRNRQRYADTETEEQILWRTADQSNAAFGMLNYTVLGRNKTLQDIFRLLCLAPNFTESRARFVGQALRPGGQEQLVALLGGAVVLYTIARLLSKLADDDWHWDRRFNTVIRGHEYSFRSIQGDIYHLYDDPRGFLYNRMNPTYLRPVVEALSGRDRFGKKRGFMRQFQDWLVGQSPIPIQGFLNPSRDYGILQSALQAIGAYERKFRTRAERLAREKVYETLPLSEQTREQEAKGRLMAGLVENVRAGERPTAEIRQKAGNLSPAEMQTILRRGSSTQLAEDFKRLPIKEAAEVWIAADAKERRTLRPLFLEKATNAIKKAAPSEVAEITDIVRAALGETVTPAVPFAGLYRQVRKFWHPGVAPTKPTSPAVAAARP